MRASVNGDVGRKRADRTRATVVARFSPKTRVFLRIPVLCRAARIHQWPKNLLVFLPAIAAHDFRPETWMMGAVAFIAVSLSSSAVYLVNDIADRHVDRHHPTKRFRPIANEDLRPGSAAWMAVLCVAIAFLFAMLLPTSFGLVIFGYLVLAFAYTYALKRIRLGDLVALTVLFQIRVVAGSEAVDIPLSPWSLAFTLPAFLALASLKRYAEIRQLQATGTDRVSGRNYWIGDQILLKAVGTASGAASVAALAAYVVFMPDSASYDRPGFLFAIVGLFGWWMSHAWRCAIDGAMHFDLVVFAVKDRLTIGLVASVIILFWLSV